MLKYRVMDQMLNDMGRPYVRSSNTRSIYATSESTAHELECVSNFVPVDYPIDASFREDSLIKKYKEAMDSTIKYSDTDPENELLNIYQNIRNSQILK